MGCKQKKWSASKPEIGRRDRVGLAVVFLLPVFLMILFLGPHWWGYTAPPRVRQYSEKAKDSPVNIPVMYKPTSAPPAPHAVLTLQATVRLPESPQGHTRRSGTGTMLQSPPTVPKTASHKPADPVLPVPSCRNHSKALAPASLPSRLPPAVPCCFPTLPSVGGHIPPLGICD